MHDAVHSQQEMEQGKFDPQDELRRYLESPLVGGVVDIVSHWGVGHYYVYNDSESRH